MVELFAEDHSPHGGFIPTSYLLRFVIRPEREAANHMNTERIYVQFGSGLSGPKSWRNFDSSPTLRFERIPILGKLYTKNKTRFAPNIEYGDIIKDLPFSANSVHGIYASHVLEHLALNDFRIALRNIYNILRPNGIFRLIVPDLELYAKNYMSSTDPLSAVTFMKRTSLGVATRPKSFLGFFKSWLGNSRHLSMWDFNSLKIELLSPVLRI